MQPCCLEVISCEKHDELKFQNARGTSLLGGNIGKHHYCPKNAEEAREIVSGSYVSYLYP